MISVRLAEESGSFFIKEWWGGGDSVTLLTRPRHFRKTLNMSMLENFFLPTMKGGETSLKVFPF